LPPAPELGSSVWQGFYGSVLALRARLLRATAARLPVPVISVGNLHWGGGGKTPFTIALASWLSQRDLPVAVLSRGYKRTSSGALVVSRGRGPEVSVEEAGDEPFEMARALPGVGVVVAAQRAEAGRLALATLEPRPRLLLLDDAFSHARLARDLDLLLFPWADPWGNGRLLPAGRLREPLAAGARADAAILTGVPAEAAGEGLGAALAGVLSGFGFRGPGFASRTQPLAARIAGGPPLDPGARVYAVAAIARPEPFFAAIDRVGLTRVGHSAFADHDAYPDERVRELESAARAAGAVALLTTAKDRAKLEGRLTFPLAVLPVEARPEAEFWRWFERRIGALVG